MSELNKCGEMVCGTSECKKYFEDEVRQMARMAIESGSSLVYDTDEFMQIPRDCNEIKQIRSAASSVGRRESRELYLSDYPSDSVNSADRWIHGE